MKNQLMAMQIDLVILALKQKLPLPNGQEPLELLATIAETLRSTPQAAKRGRKKKVEGAE